MWHELVLHGIGGRTIAEAKERLTHDEFTSWVAYRRERGTLHVGMSLEAGFALIASMIARATGGTAEMRDFMPHVDDDVLEDTPENLMKLMQPKRGAR